MVEPAGKCIQCHRRAHAAWPNLQSRGCRSVLTLDVAPVALDHVDQVIHCGVLFEQQVAVVDAVLLLSGRGRGRRRLVGGARIGSSSGGPSGCSAGRPRAEPQAPPAFLQDALHHLVIQVGEGHHGGDGHAARLLLAKRDVGGPPVQAHAHLRFGGAMDARVKDAREQLCLNEASKHCTSSSAETSVTAGAPTPARASGSAGGSAACPRPAPSAAGRRTCTRR